MVEPPRWQTFNPPDPEGFTGDTLAAREARRASYLRACVCTYCGDLLQPGQQWGFVEGRPTEPGSLTVRAHIVHRACWEQDA